jgi:hypothetical protein
MKCSTLIAVLLLTATGIGAVQAQIRTDVYHRSLAISVR